MSRTPRPSISRRSATDAALAVIDQQGLEKFGLNTVAARLGIQAPSLYHHFSGKEELLREVARLLLIDGRLPEAAQGNDWQAEVIRISRASWRSITKHPQAAPLMLRFFPRVLLSGAYEHWACYLHDCGVPREQQILVLEGSEKITFGSALFVAAGRANNLEPFPVGDPLRHPYLAAARQAHRFNEEETFVACLKAMLQGMAQLPTPTA